MALTPKEKELLKSVLEKRSACIPLTPEEDKFASETFDKLLAAKSTMQKRNWYTLTGEQVKELKKAASFVGQVPSETHVNRLAEAAGGLEQAKTSPKAEDPTKSDKHSDQAGKIGDDDAKGKPKASDKDADEDKNDLQNEADRREMYTREKAGVIKFEVGNLVVRETRMGKEVGVVAGVSSKGGLTVLWKSTMTQTFETPDSVKKVYKGKLVDKNYKEEEDEITPPVKKAGAFRFPPKDDVGTEEEEEEVPGEEGMEEEAGEEEVVPGEEKADEAPKVDENGEPIDEGDAPSMDEEEEPAAYLENQARREGAEHAEEEGADVVPQAMELAEQVISLAERVARIGKLAKGEITHTEAYERVVDQPGVEDPHALAQHIVEQAGGEKKNKKK